MAIDEKSVEESVETPSVFISYKWESEKHKNWVRQLATDLRNFGIDAKLDQWEVRPGDSFTDYMQSNISKPDVMLFVITADSVQAAEASEGKGGAVKFEVQMMNAKRISEGTRIIGIYRSGDRAPNYLSDHRYLDFRKDTEYSQSLTELVNSVHGIGGPPPIRNATVPNYPPAQPIVIIEPNKVFDGGDVSFQVESRSNSPLVWLSRSLQGPRGNIYSGGSGWKFQEQTSGVWVARWTEHISKWTPSGTYQLSRVSVRSASELTSQEAPTATFEISNTLESTEPTIETVNVSSYRVSPGESIDIRIVAISSAPIVFLSRSFDGPRGNIYGGGSGTRFSETEPGVWVFQWKESFSKWAPVGKYILSMLRVKNEAQLESLPWPNICVELVVS